MGQSENSLPTPAPPCAALPAAAPAATLPESLTWSATLAPEGDGEAREIEITDEMVRAAIVEIEREQTWPFAGASAAAGAPSDGSSGQRAAPPVARPVRKADVIVFPGKRVRDDA